MTFNLIAEEGEQEEDEGGDGQTEDKGDEHDHRGLRAHLACGRRIVDELTLVGGGGQ